MTRVCTREDYFENVINRECAADRACDEHTLVISDMIIIYIESVKRKAVAQGICFRPLLSAPRANPREEAQNRIFVRYRYFLNDGDETVRLRRNHLIHERFVLGACGLSVAGDNHHDVRRI